MSVKDAHYCGDCLYLRIKRDKKGNITGETYCTKWDALRTLWQNCDTHFKDKSIILEDLPLLRDEQLEELWWKTIKETDAIYTKQFSGNLLYRLRENAKAQKQLIEEWLKK